MIQVLKELLRERGLSYQNLAEALGMSESGVKKLMTGKDISFSRLEKICKVCEISLLEVVTKANQEKISDVFLSSEQEQFLLKNPKIFNFYWKLRVDQISRSEFHKKYKVELSTTQKWLTGLEKIGLLKVTNKGQVEFTHQGLIRWNSDSPLVKYLHSRWSPQVIERAIEKTDAFNFINLSGLYLDQGAAQDLRKDLLEIFERYSKLSQSYKSQRSSSRIGFLAGFAPFDFELD